MGLAGGMVIDRLVVNDTPGATVTFGSDDHPAGPEYWIIDWYLLNNTKPLVPGQASFDIMNPVDRYLTGLVDSDWLCIFSNIKAERRRLLHQGEWLVRGAVKCT